MLHKLILTNVCANFPKGLLIGSLLSILAGGVAQAEYRLSILHMNDEQSRIESINKYNSTCSSEDETEGKCFGGIARMKTLIDEQRKALSKDGNVLVLNGGDEFSGSLFYTTYKGRAIAEFLNEIGIDAMTVGNHEFDNGPETLAKFVDEAKFPVVSGNASLYFEPSLKDKIPGYVIVEKGGEKIGIIGVVTPETKNISSPGDNIAFLDQIEYLTTIIPEVKAKGTNKIIVLSHSGFNMDKKIAAAVNDVDVIVGGHTNTLLSNTLDGAEGPYPVMIKNPSGQNVPVVQAGAYSRYLGALTLVFDVDGNVTSASGDTIELDSKIKPDEGFLVRIKELAAPIEKLKNQRIGDAVEAIGGEKSVCREQECAMGNLVSDAMLDRVKDQGISMAIQNGGGLRASIDAGEITMGEVLTVLPFQNTLATFKLSGADIIASLESGLSQVEEGSGRFPQVAGIRYAWSVKGEAGKDRIKSVDIKSGDKWEPLDEDQMYGVVSNNFMRNGGDGYDIFKANAQSAYDFGPGLEEAVAAYIGEHSPYTPAIDGRIINCDTTPTGDRCGEMAASEETAEVEVKAEPVEESVKAETESKPVAEVAPEPEAESDSNANATETAETSTEMKKEEEAAAAEEASEEEPAKATAEESSEKPETDMVEKPAASEPATSEATSSESAASEPVVKEETASEETASEETAPVTTIKRGRYTLQEGDTLWNIAERAYGNGSKWRKIRRANRSLRRSRRLKPGRTIYIP